MEHAESAVSKMRQLRDVGVEAKVPTLLQQFLACRMRQGIDNLFGLLELLYPPDDIRADNPPVGIRATSRWPELRP